MLKPTHFDLQSLRIFMLVAENGSVTRASEKAHMTMSAVSKRIADLERTVDCPLFQRLPRGLMLTAAGHELMRHAKSVLETVNRMSSAMGDFAIGVRGHVRVWANTSAVVQFLPADLAAFLSKEPLIRISLEEKLSHEVVDAVMGGVADVGVFADNVHAPGLQKYQYREDSLVVLVPPEHPLAGLAEVSFADTLDFDFVGLNQGSSLLNRMSEAAATLERVLKLRIQVTSFDAICRMIEAGLGIGILPAGAVRQEILVAGLRAVRLSDPWANRSLWLGVKDARVLQPEALKLVEHLCGMELDVSGGA
ncbi:LysR family transcriptional regulator [Cupriavidus pauculus]|uniref:LysR family transcriptional regulator n=1 Tax=Cupriavidus pauculus TaxID=82633 RepID=UPI001EE2E446|nr:LysR family transcriptional regulator [Cupriavidus pauculus]GJG97676.1 LysR family transcriptional regulator [Cupriavidus pauculus]